jgi:S-adenosylmethionine decarboxylase proenzyme
MSNYTPQGKHIHLDFFNCKRKALTRPLQVRAMVHKATKVCGMTYRRCNWFRYPDNSFSMTVFISESHIAFSTYPEHNYVGIEFFGCGDPDLKKFIRIMRRFFVPEWIKQEKIWLINFK